MNSERIDWIVNGSVREVMRRADYSAEALSGMVRASCEAVRDVMQAEYDMLESLVRACLLRAHLLDKECAGYAWVQEPLRLAVKNGVPSGIEEWRCPVCGATYSDAGELVLCGDTPHDCGAIMPPLFLRPRAAVLLRMAQESEEKKQGEL